MPGWSWTANRTEFRVITPTKPYGIFVQGDSVRFTFAAGATANAYEVRDYWGDVVSMGSFTGLTVEPTPPLGGWGPGWYRTYFSGPVAHPVYGNAYGEFNFIVMRNDPRFPTIPPSPPIRGGNPRNMALKAAIGATSRIVIGDAGNLSRGDGSLADAVACAADTNNWWANPSNSQHGDTARNRRPWIAFDSLAVDSANVAGLACYVADPSLDGSQIFVQVDAGTASGHRVTVRFPDANTVVETYDNLASIAEAVAALSTSAYVRAFGGGVFTGTVSATAIGRTRWDNVITVVQSCYPVVECYEGPVNEGGLNALTAHRMRIFHANIKAANPAAIAIGPTPVAIDDPTGLEEFLGAGGATWCDEIAIHNYNALSAGLAAGRAIMDEFFARLSQVGADSKPIWDTESNTTLIGWQGTYRPRQAWIVPFYMVFMEQYGIAKERVNYWYDHSHGFWDFPGWLIQNSGSPNPHVAMIRTLAEETFGKPHAERLDFGAMGENFFLGSIFRESAGQPGVLAVASVTPLPRATVTFRVSGMSGGILATIDCMGAESKTPIVNGRLTLPVTPEMTYVRLPANVSVTVERCMNWPLTERIVAAMQSRYADRAAIDNVALPINNGALARSRVRTDRWELWQSAQPAPTTVSLHWRTPVYGDRIILVCYPTARGNGFCTPLAFTVETSPDGTTWTTQASVDQTAEATSIPWRSHQATNCLTESYWLPQWVHDIPFAEPATFQKVRIVITALSYGDEPDAVGGAVTYAPATPIATVQEVFVMADANAEVQLTRAS